MIESQKDSAITSRIKKTEGVKWRNLQFLQQEDFKQWIPSGDKKLCESILKYQFIDPFKVWQDGDVIYCLDGRHRHDDLLIIEQNGMKVPDLLDATFIDCRNRKEAAEMVLIYSSRYAAITEKGLMTFLLDYEINLPDVVGALEIPELSIEKLFGDLQRDFSTANQEFDTGEFTDQVVLKLTFSRQEYIIIKQRIAELMPTRGLSTPEQLIKELLFPDATAV